MPPSPHTIAELLGDAAPANPSHPAARVVEGVGLDSRRIGPGELYLALGGASVHGIVHAEEALARGAAAIAVDAEEARAAGPTARAALERLEARAVPLVDVPALAARVAEIAGRVHDHPDRALALVAVTGTDGKSSVCRFVAEALERLGTPAGYVGTLGWGRGDARVESLAPNPLTTPDAVSLRRMLAALRDDGARAVALEASSHGLAGGRLDALAIDVAVLTNLGRDHLDYHGSLDAYRAAKARLFAWPSLGAIVVNGDDAFGCELAARAQGASRRIVYSIGAAAEADAVASAGPDTAGEGATTAAAAAVVDGALRIGAEAVRATPTGLAFTLVDGACRFPIESALLGRFNVANLLACHGVLRALGHAPERAAGVLGALAPVAGRMERFAGPPTVVVDYAHTPQALAAALEAARAHCAGALWVVFGCGGDRDRGKRAPMGRAAERGADRVVVTDDNPRGEPSRTIIEQALAGMEHPTRATVIAERPRAIAHAIAEAAPEDLVLVAGKGHEDYQIVGERRLAMSDRAIVRARLAGGAA